MAALNEPRRIVVLDYPDWIRLSAQKKVFPILNPQRSIAVLFARRETKHWRLAIHCSIAFILLGLVGSGFLLFTKWWWAGLLAIAFIWFTVRPAILDSVYQEILSNAGKSTVYFSATIAYGALRFSVAESDLEGIQFLPGDADMSFMLSSLDKIDADET